MTPSDLIQHNFYRLKTHLQPDPVLDYLLQQQIFSQDEYDKCSEQPTRQGKCQELLVLLKAKGEAGYREFISILSKTQSHVKEILDKYAEDNGATDFVYVSKDLHEKEVRECEKTIEGLKKERDEIQRQFETTISNTRKELHDKQDELKEEIFELQNTCRTQKETFRVGERKIAQQMKQEQDRTLAAEKSLEEAKKENNALRQYYNDIYQRLEGLHRKYEVLNIVEKSQEKEDADDDLFLDACETPLTHCNLMRSKVCDKEHLQLLHCLHAGCKACTEQRKDHLECKCGRISPVEELPTDYVRQNELLFSTEHMECGYLTTQCSDDAVALCCDCHTPLCLECKRNHAIVKNNIKHVVIDVFDLNDCPVQTRLKKSTCSVHKGEIVTYFDIQCKEAICQLCQLEKHQNHPIKSLDKVYNELKESLSLKIDQHRELVGKVKAHFTRRCELVTVLESVQVQVEQKISSVHKNIAEKLLERFTNLLKKLRDTVKSFKRILGEDIDALRQLGKNLTASMHYAEKSVAFVTQAEFIELHRYVNSKLTEDLEKDIPDVTDRNMHVSFYPKGLKAIEELIEMVGDIDLANTDGEQEDSLPTYKDIECNNRDLQKDLMQLKDVLEIKELEVSRNTEKIEDLNRATQEGAANISRLNTQKQSLKRQIRDLQDQNRCLKKDRDNMKVLLRTKGGQVTNHNEKASQSKDLVERDFTVQNDQEMFVTVPDQKQQKQTINQEDNTKAQTIETTMVNFTTELDNLCKKMSSKDNGMHFFRCVAILFPNVQMDEMKVNLNRVSINTHGELINQKSEAFRKYEDRLKTYSGVCSVVPLPHGYCPVYWEISPTVLVKTPLSERSIVLEIGICPKDEMDSNHYIGDQPHSYCMYVGHCLTHKSLCRKGKKEGKKVLCLQDTLPNEEGSKATLHFGVVFDEASQRIGFIDVKEEMVIFAMDNIDIRKPMWPMFGLYNHKKLTTSMKLLVGSDINMTLKKERLIQRCLE